MPPDKSKEEEAPDGAGAPSGGRKRRISKRERKNLKRQRLASAAAPSSNDTAAPPAGRPPPPPTLDEYMRDYAPPPAAAGPSKDEEEAIDAQSLGKWFPTARTVKSSVCYSNDQAAGGSAATGAADREPRASLVLFYQYVSPPWSQSTVTRLMSHLARIARDHRTNVGGRIRVSTEGVNCTISAASTGGGTADPGFEAARTLRHLAEDLRRFDPVAFRDTDFKYIDGLSADRHFKELKLIPVKELVFYGIREEDCAGAKKGGGAEDSAPKEGKEVKGGVHLDAKDYHEMLKREDAVVIGEFHTRARTKDRDFVSSSVARTRHARIEQTSGTTTRPPSAGSTARWTRPRRRTAPILRRETRGTTPPRPKRKGARRTSTRR